VELVQRVESVANVEERYSSWKTGFTDPSAHDINYTYLVHGLASPMQRGIQAIALHQLGADITKMHDIDLEREPLRIAEKSIISSSVIDRRHRSTWGDAGLILQVPPENIIGIYPQDAGTPFHDVTRVVEPSDPELACTVEELLEQTSPTMYNEVVLKGTTETGKVDVAGFFIKKFYDNSLVEEDLARKMFSLGRQYNLPVVEILDASPRQPKGAENHTSRFTLPPGVNLDFDLSPKKEEH
jgi:hypothetical protein